MNTFTVLFTNTDGNPDDGHKQWWQQVQSTNEMTIVENDDDDDDHNNHNNNNNNNNNHNHNHNHNHHNNNNNNHYE